MGTAGSVDRLYPIGALSEREVADIRNDPLCEDAVALDALISEWRGKSETFRSQPREPLAVLDSDLAPLGVSQQIGAKIDSLLSVYRNYLPVVYDLAFVPITKLVSPQRYVELDYTTTGFRGLTRALTADENAEYCLGTPARASRIDASFLGYQKGEPGEFTYLYQFSSDDQNVRYIPGMPLEPVRDLDISAARENGSYDVRAVTVLVGPGLPFVHVLKVPIGFDSTATRRVYRLVISNGVHRIFSLARLGNTHVAAMVQPILAQELPDPFVDTAREALLGSDALRITAMLNSAITRTFKWKKSRRVVRLQVKVVQEVSYL